MSASLVLGPVLRYVDATQATVWVQTDRPCEVEVLGHRARTFTVDAHHFALVVVTGLAPGASTPYGVTLDGRRAWPPPDHPFPPSTVRTPGAGARVRLAFGSCREIAPHEPPFTGENPAEPTAHGIDALRTYAVELAGAPEPDRPDALLMLGDQLYADEPPRHVTKALRRREDRPNGAARATTFAEYALLYREAWREPAVRWLLSTVPSMMVFDDHEILDEWKISQAWVDEHRGQPTYERRVTAGLMAYWIFQHVGNLSPAELAGDELVARVRRADDAGAIVRDFAADADRQVGRSRWSFCRELGRVRLVVLDSRAARRLAPGDRRIIDDAEWRWATERVADLAGVDHLLLASSLPFFLPAGLHELEAIVERAGDGAWGPVVARLAERVRRALHLGHWASFQLSFHRLVELVEQAARGAGGRRPASVVLLSGDVHHSYLAQLAPDRARAAAPVWQVVSSPLRKRLAAYERAAMRASASAVAARAGARLGRAVGLPAPPVRWRLCEPPRSENQIAVLELDGDRAHVRLRTPAGSDWHAPRLRTVWERRLA